MKERIRHNWKDKRWMKRKDINERIKDEWKEKTWMKG